MKKRRALLRKKNQKREERKRRSRVFFRFFLVLFLVASVTIGGRMALSHLRIFSLATLAVQGDPKTLSPDEIIHRSGVEKGVNLFAIDIQQVQARLKQHPFFKSVTVQRHLPNTLLIRVEEYHPEFVLSTGRLYYIDAEGGIFKDITDTQDSRDFPVLTGISEEMLLQDPLRVQASLRQAAELKKAYLQSPLYPSLGLSELHFDKNIGFTLYPEKQKYSIKVGLKDFSEKISKLRDHWEQISQSKASISSIDLNYPGKILMTL